MGLFFFANAQRGWGNLLGARALRSGLSCQEMITACPGDRGAGNRARSGFRRCLKSRSKITDCEVSKTLTLWAAPETFPARKAPAEHPCAQQRALPAAAGQGGSGSPCEDTADTQEELIGHCTAFLPSTGMKGLGSRPWLCHLSPGLGCLEVVPPTSSRPPAWRCADARQTSLQSVSSP